MFQNTRKHWIPVGLAVAGLIAWPGSGDTDDDDAPDEATQKAQEEGDNQDGDQEPVDPADEAK